MSYREIIREQVRAFVRCLNAESDYTQFAMG